jgi:uncharacterized protein YuzE
MSEKTIKITSTMPPVVEFDSSVRAAYVRFSDKKVARTEPVETKESIVTIDFDSEDEVVGVELIGVKEFSITSLLKESRISAPQNIIDRTQYLPAASPVA